MEKLSSGEVLNLRSVLIANAIQGAEYPPFLHSPIRRQQMKPHTIDVYTDEMLVICLLLGQFIDAQTKLLRNPTTCREAAEQIRIRIEIAVRLRGKMPLVINQETDDTRLS